jgi:hypothetical protein
MAATCLEWTTIDGTHLEDLEERILRKRTELWIGTDDAPQ